MTMPSHLTLPSAADLAAVSASRTARWRPGLGDASHSEVFAGSAECAGAAVALSLALDDWRMRDRPEIGEAEDRRAVLWVQTRAAVKLGGRPYRPGLPREVSHRLIHVIAEKDADALFALEEGLRCREIAFVMGEVVGNPKVLDFTASRRLSLAAERHGVKLWLVRLDARPDLSSARLRWRVEAAPSSPHGPNTQAPGTPAWHATLFRARAHAPGEWILTDDGRALSAARSRDENAAPYPVDLVRRTPGRSLAAV